MAERRTKSPRKAARKTARKTARKVTPKRWSQRVTRESDALDLTRGVFKQTSAKKIAASLKRSAERSSRRKSGAYRSALSMLTFYINRAGKNLPKTRRERLERAKVELKHQFGRE
jgi:transcription initiation factor TFIIIB Brf1 subunit/transcription initiation factor TFIIB